MSTAQLLETIRVYVNLYSPSVIIVETDGAGAVLAEELEKRINPEIQIVHVRTQGRSKLERLLNVLPYIHSGCIFLPDGRSWVEDYIQEFVEFSGTKNADQVDATTQFLDFARDNGPIPLIAARSVGALGTKSGTFSAEELSIGPPLPSTYVFSRRK